MGKAPKTHLAHRRTGGVTVSACGITASRMTRNPNEVTCGACKRTIHMADSEARAAINKHRV